MNHIIERLCPAVRLCRVTSLSAFHLRRLRTAPIASSTTTRIARAATSRVRKPGSLLAAAMAPAAFARSPAACCLVPRPRYLRGGGGLIVVGPGSEGGGSGAGNFSCAKLNETAQKRARRVPESRDRGLHARANPARVSRSVRRGPGQRQRRTCGRPWTRAWARRRNGQGGATSTSDKTLLSLSLSLSLSPLSRALITRAHSRSPGEALTRAHSRSPGEWEPLEALLIVDAQLANPPGSVYGPIHLDVEFGLKRLRQGCEIRQVFLGQNENLCRFDQELMKTSLR